MCAAWAGDNTGPPPLQEVAGFYTSLRGRYPQAEVAASTFDAFFAVANEPAIKAQLPVVTQEIEDGWIYGVPSDPLKNAQFREAARHRSSCLASGACQANSPAVLALERLLVKVPEHTWGVAQGWFLPDNENWTNTQFDAARAQQALGFIENNAHHADYNSTVGSWQEQRTFVTGAPALLAKQYPDLAANLSAALDRLKHVVPPTLTGLKKLDLHAPISCGGSGVTLEFGAGGGLRSLKKDGVEWAGGEEQPLGQYLYESYTSADFNVFLKDLGSRIGDNGVWPNHTAGRYANFNASTSDDTCGNFCKNNMSSANPKRRSLRPTLTGLFQSPSDGCDDGVACVIIAQGTLPLEASTMAGAPQTVLSKLTVSHDGLTLDWELYQLDKRPTRLAEATFFSFVPDLAHDSSVRPIVLPKTCNRVLLTDTVSNKLTYLLYCSQGEWSLSVLGSKMDPTDTLGHVATGTGSPQSDYLMSVYGGSPHLRGVESASWHGTGGKGFTLSSLDVPILCTGVATPFVSPRTEQPDMTKGVHWNIFQNIWNTK